jgi:hypothetical protein
MRKVLYGMAVTMWSWVLIAPSVAFAAEAKGGGERVGENIGNLLGGWAKSLYVGIASVVALMFLMNRRFADLAVFMVAVLIVGGFVMAPNDIAGTVRDIWQTITS